MHRADHSLSLSATDLSNFLGCRHRTAQDLAVADGLTERPWFHNPLLEVLKKRGMEHEARYVDHLRAEGRTIADLGTVANRAQHIAATLDAMRRGADVIVQGALADGPWYGLPDVMRRVDRSSEFGEWSYEIDDTKLSRETRAGTMLQLGLYSEMLGSVQGARPEFFYVVTPDGATGQWIHQYRVDDYAAYFRWVRARLIATVALGSERIAAENYPEPVEACEVCHWAVKCADRRREDDHLSLVAGIGAGQRRELESHSIDTLTNLASLPLPIPFKPTRASIATYVRVREQARLQYDSRGKTPPLHELLPVEPSRGLCRLPEPNAGDLFLDLEGDPLAIDGGREYLFGLASADGAYRGVWAFNEAEEKRAFEWLIDIIEAAVHEHPEMHVYHYAPYEPAALKRLMGRYATRERELDVMLRAGRLVDLYAATRQALRAGVERYSIKNLEALFDFRRAVDLRDANRNRARVEQALEMGIPESIPREARNIVEGYNRDDCLSTLRLREWLEAQRTFVVDAGTDVPRPTFAAGAAPPAIDERAQRVEALRVRLLDGIPESKRDRTPEQQGKWLLAYMLDYHRREQKSTWWEYFRLCDLDDEELLDERKAVAGLHFVERVEVRTNKRTKKPTGKVVDRYWHPQQEMEIETDDDVRLPDPTAKPLGTVAAVNRANCTIDLEKRAEYAEHHPTAVFAFDHVGTGVIEESLMRIGEAVAEGRPGVDAARALLACEPPRLMTGTLCPRDGESAGDLAVRIAGLLDRTVLPIQGPPGAGKTHCGARMICELVRQGKRVGITATSHAVILKLIDEVAKQARGDGLPIRLAHKNGDGTTYLTDQIHGLRLFDDNDEARDALRNGEIDVMGGTSWFWTRPDTLDAVDVLFIDEAGQMALPNVVAVSQAANSIVLLGDPQQLEQPRRGSHPDGVDVSALEHLLAGHQTIVKGRGIFLPETWRLAPSICRFTSEVFYENRLSSRSGLERQLITGVDRLPASGLVLATVEHEGNRSASDEEVEAVSKIIAHLTASGATWTHREGESQALRDSNILVIAPYNAHVNRLSARLAGTRVQVGTVDKFQGREAAVTIYSMATSTPDDAPRGLEFLYSLNRLNVATSRARCLSIIVASPRLLEVECRSPRQIKLVNGLCRYRELAAEVRLQ